MKSAVLALVVLIGLAGAYRALAAPPRRDPCPPPCGACVTWCCDDYCRKPLPCAPRVPCGCCDDYCRKPLPCPPPVPCGTCDDYCRKPLPGCPRNCEPWYRCVPTNPAGLFGVPAVNVAPATNPAPVAKQQALPAPAPGRD